MDQFILKFRVSESVQTSGGGDYVVKFDATVELRPGCAISVEIDSLHESSDPVFEEAAKNAIQVGFKSILQTRNLAGNCRIENLLLHPVDFKPIKFTECSADALSAQLALHPLS